MNDIDEVIERLETEDVSVNLVILHPRAPSITFLSSMTKGEYTPDALNDWVQEAGRMAIEAAVEEAPCKYGLYMHEPGATVDVIF